MGTRIQSETSPQGAEMKPKGSKELITEYCDKLKELLLKKNADYDDSYIDPINIFSQELPWKQIETRMDDKLRRIKNRKIKNFKESDFAELASYLVLYMIVADVRDGKVEFNKPLKWLEEI